MDIPTIISLLETGQIDVALKEADLIQFTGDEKITYNRKKDVYINSLKGQNLIDWIKEMKVFLNGCNSKFGNYKDDPLNRWHHLDKKVLKEKFKILCRDKSFPIKVLFFENNTEAMSHRVHEILYSYHSSRYPKIIPSSLKGNMNDDVIDLNSESNLQDDWTEFMQKIFGLNVPFHQIPDEFKKNGFHKQPHFVIQSIDKFCFEHFKVYYDFWTTLEPEQSLFLFLHVPGKTLPKDLHGPNYFVWYDDQYEFVDNTDFTRFFSAFTCYNEDLTLCNCERMTFHDAIEKLQFSDKNI
jgi:hypothetical protein